MANGLLADLEEIGLLGQQLAVDAFLLTEGHGVGGNQLKGSIDRLHDLEQQFLGWLTFEPRFRPGLQARLSACCGRRAVEAATGRALPGELLVAAVAAVRGSSGYGFPRFRYACRRFFEGRREVPARSTQHDSEQTKGPRYRTARHAKRASARHAGSSSS